MAWSKYDPHAPEADALEATSETAARRAMILRWGNWISLGMLALGYALIVFWLTR